jgi:hypothetical protein
MRTLLTYRIPWGSLCLGFWFCCCEAVQAEEFVDVSTPLTIVTSGKAASAALSNEVGEAKQVVLSALGRQWAGSSGIEKHTAAFDVPTVRVRTTFQVIDPFRPKRTLGEVVAYPADTRCPWNEKFVISLGPSVPKVFREFLAVHKIPFSEWSGEDSADLGKQPGLLIDGKEEAGETFRAARDLRLKCGRNLLVFDAPWYQHIEPQLVRIEPWYSFGEDGLPNQDPPRDNFPAGSTIWSARFDRYWPGVASRKDVLFVHHDDDRSPEVIKLLVELVWVLPSGEGMYLSYLDWESLLGRSDEIDYWFPRLLHGLSHSQIESQRLNRYVQIAWPPLANVTAREHPVLAALADAEGAETIGTAGAFPGLTMLDLRGPDLSAEAASQVKLPEPVAINKGGVQHVLVLGTDEHLHEGIWAKDAPAKLAAQKFAERYQLERSRFDRLPLTESGAFTDAASRMQQVYRVTSFLTLFDIFIPPRQLEFYPEPGDANSK